MLLTNGKRDTITSRTCCLLHVVRTRRAATRLTVPGPQPLAEEQMSTASHCAVPRGSIDCGQGQQLRRMDEVGRDLLPGIRMQSNNGVARVGCCTAGVFRLDGALAHCAVGGPDCRGAGACLPQAFCSKSCAQESPLIGVGCASINYRGSGLLQVAQNLALRVPRTDNSG